ncbi:shikimate kinase [Lyticum sinuosum]|uniref:Shikimate kinase n=1 Tax=Lyticum sinuosum TaxID=1332059 RepID=A0AAE5AHY3_9RICK|nr:shikimate kinase [Lyticum sinuosum]MDZ5761314.1 putative AroK-like nucleoside/nucleotide kinase superfamily protein [Lyticum sinuosum]
MQSRNLYRQLQKIEKSISIIGLAGSGKSTIGKRLARKIGIPVYDTDSHVEKLVGHNKVEIYDFQGKEFFKKKEKEAVKEILSYGIIVMSTGNETYLDDELRNLINEKCITVWLKADIETLYSRIIRRNTRPEIDRLDDKKAALQKMIDDTSHIYQNANITVTSQDMDPHYIIDAIIAKLNRILNNVPIS